MLKRVSSISLLLLILGNPLMAQSQDNNILITEPISKEKFLTYENFYNKVHKDFLKSSKKSEDLGLYLKDSNIGIENTLVWYYGPNIGYSKADIELMCYLDKPTLYPGFGLKDQFQIQFNKLFKTNLNISNEVKAKSLGFSSLEELYLSIYQRLTFSSKYEFIDLLRNLEKNGILKFNNLKKYSNPEPLINSFFEIYIKNNVLDNQIFLIENYKKYFLNKSDFSAYYLSMYILKQILKNANNRENLYAI